MSTSVIEPGTRLAGRFRLEDRVSEAGGSTLWKAIDEILARPVAVRTFDPGFPRVAAVVTGARAVSRLNDPRLTQVFDADDSTEHAYVVSEWVGGETLEDLLTHGPMETDRAVGLVAEVAEAIATAHAGGLAHLFLMPRNLVWTDDGRVKVIGLGIEAALAGVVAEDPALADAHGLGRMLYASLTAHWPGAEGETALPAAPLFDGQLCAPRQVRAGVSNVLDSITCRALGVHTRRGQEPYASPAEVAEALAYVPREPLSLFAPTTDTPPALLDLVAPPDDEPTTFTRPAGRSQTSPLRVPADTGNHHAVGHSEGRHAARQPVNKGLVALTVALILVVVGVGGWQLSRLGAGDDSKATTSLPGQTQSNQLKPAAVKGLDPTGGDSSALSEANAKKAVDGSSGTHWRTQWYATKDFGKRKKGLGLLLDMGKSVKVSSIKVTVTGTAPGSLEMRVGDSESPNLSTVATRKGDAVGTFTLQPRDTAEGRYIVLWFTELPTDETGKFRAQLDDVVVTGTN